MVESTLTASSISSSSSNNDSPERDFVRDLDRSPERDLDRDVEHTLSYGNQVVVVAPFGASLRRFYLKTESGDWNLIWGYHGGANKKGGQGDVLIPFPGRIKGGTYKLAGKTFELVKNDKDGPNAIHGFLRAALFKTEMVSETQVRFSSEILAKDFESKGYPFSIRVEVTYALAEDGLRTSFRIENIGSNSAPVGAGFHPYFRAKEGSLADWKVTIPARDYIELENIVPTGRVLSVEGTPLDFNSGRVVNEARYNDCLAHLKRDANGIAEIIVEDRTSSSRLVLKLDSSFDYVVIYTGDQIPAPDHRQGFAIEPMTCGPDAFNHEGWGTKVLEAGASFSGSYAIKAETTV